MVAADLIENVVEIGGGYYTRTKILAKLNMEQNSLLGSSCRLMRRVVELQTTAGQLVYALPAVGSNQIRQVTNAFVSAPLTRGTSVSPTEKSAIVGSDGSVYRYRVNGVTFSASNAVTPTGTVTFPIDPAGRLVFLEVYVWPYQLLSESDEVTVPDEYTGLLELAVLQRLYERGYGNADNLEVRKKKEKAAWSIFLASLEKESASRPAWGFN